MPQVTSTALNLYIRGMGDVIKLYPEKQNNFWRMITPNTKTLEELYDEKTMLSGMGVASKMQETGGIPFDQITTPYSRKTYLDIYSIGFEVSDQALEKKGGAVLRAPSKFMSQSLYIAWEQSIADIMNNSQSASFTGIDAVALASASHPTASTTWSNLSTGATLSIAALEQMLTDAMGQQAYRDYVWPAMGPFNLVVPRQKVMLGRRLLKGTEQPQTTDREQNVAKDSISAVYGNPFLTSSTRYALLPVNADDNPIKVLTYGDVRVKQSYDGRKPTNLFTATREWATTWDDAHNTQFNAGA